MPHEETEEEALTVLSPHPNLKEPKQKLIELGFESNLDSDALRNKLPKDFAKKNGNFGEKFKASRLTLNEDANNPPTKHQLTRENIIKAWVNLDGLGTLSIIDSFNVSSVVDNDVGDYTINWDTDFKDDKYVVVGMTSEDGGKGVLVSVKLPLSTNKTAGSVTITLRKKAGEDLEDVDYIGLIAVGRQ